MLVVDVFLLIRFFVCIKTQYWPKGMLLESSFGLKMPGKDVLVFSWIIIGF